ncbi:MAG: hypothetical protein JWP63_1509 [Candidatus Solibacter sp.]|nr:hypothetical protein [Candidatus Solibacter sp.]
MGRQKRKWVRFNDMSVLLPRGDIIRSVRHVRKVPTAVIHDILSIWIYGPSSPRKSALMNTSSFETVHTD